MSFYLHSNDFDGIIPVDNAMPSDVKRLISHCNHNYHKRYYFFSPSQRAFYRYHHYDKIAVRLSTSRCNKCYKVNLLPDENKGTGITQNIHDAITISDRFMKRIENMNKLILPNLRAK